jgi:hypothetical protein
VIDSTEPVVVQGNFDNQGVRPECFQWLNGELRLSGSSPQTFEVAGQDIGEVAALGDAQFAIRSIAVAANADVTFQDDFDNDLAGQLPCSEAQYVGTLAVEAGARVTFDNCRVYADNLIADPTAVITERGCGTLVGIPVTPPAPTSEPGAVNRGRMVAVVVPPPAANAEYRIANAELDAGGNHEPRSASSEHSEFAIGYSPFARGPSSMTALRVTLRTLNHPRLCCMGQDGQGFGTSCNVNARCDVDANCSGGTPLCRHQLTPGSPNYSAFETKIRYVNSFTFPAVGGSLLCPDDGPPFDTNYRCATLGCEPEYRDWAADLMVAVNPSAPAGLVFISGDTVVPSSTLHVSNIADTCGAAATANTCPDASAPLAVGSAAWGDITTAGFGSPDGKADVLDIPAVTNKLKGVPTFFSEPRTWLKQRDPLPNTDAITVVDLSDVVDGVLAKPYPPSRTIDACPHD